MFAYSPRETRRWPAHLLVLEKGELRERPVTSLHACGGMAHDPDRDVTYVFGPWFGDGTLQRTLGTYRAGTFAPAAGAVAGERPFAAPGHLFGDTGRSGLYWLRGTSSTRPQAEMLPVAPPSVAQGTTRAGLHAVGSDGAIARVDFDGEAFTQRTPAPRGFPARESTCLGADYEGDRLLLVSGVPSGYGPFPKDAWLAANGEWSKLTLTGTAPALTEAALTYDAARAVWILASGRDKAYRSGTKTFETDEKRWKSYPSRFVDAEGQETGATHVGLMVHDAPTAQTFGLAGHYAMDRVYVYEGEGVWRLLCDTPAGGAFDVTTRTLAWREGAGVTTLDVGSLLDARAASRHALEDEATTQDKGRRVQGKGAAKGSAEQPDRSAASPSATGTPDAVWLRYQDERTDKVWFARREGAALTVRFGKRGGTLQEKTTELKTETLAQKRLGSLVREKLGKGYEHAPEGEAVAALPGRRAFHLSHTTRTKKGDAEDVWGGVPSGVTAREWPVCAECSAPMIHVATFHAHADGLPLVKHAALMAFVCGGEMCECWDAEMGANKLLLRTAKDLAKGTLEAPPKGAEVAKAMVFAYRDIFEVDAELEPDAAGPETCDKIGGYPGYRQGDEVPTCPTCEAPMGFVAQLNEHDLNFTGGGMAYIFLCREEHSAALFMQR
ncbi:MAG: WGR domain-containing protein [Myxococcales bacterium]|nr:WGR domain-containing protein [Myxococcales bacterium]